MTTNPPAPSSPSPPPSSPPARLPVRRGLYEPVIGQLTYRALLGRRRALLLAVVPALLLVLAVAIRRFGDLDAGQSMNLLDGFSLAIAVPLIALIAGTGAIGPEVDDGSIIYLMAKPISRSLIASSKFLVAAAVTVVFGAGATLVAGFIMASGPDTMRVAVAMTVAALVAGLAYTALFLVLAVYTRAAVVVGLIYIVVWEGLLGGLVSGAQRLSVHEWSLVVAERVLGSRAADLGLRSDLSFTAAVVMITVVIVGGVALAGYRLRTARLTNDE